MMFSTQTDTKDFNNLAMAAILARYADKFVIRVWRIGTNVSGDYAAPYIHWMAFPDVY